MFFSVFRCVTNNAAVNAFLYYGAAGGQVLAFLLCIAFLLIYYKYCHPTVINRVKLQNSDSDYLQGDRTVKNSYNVRAKT